MSKPDQAVDEERNDSVDYAKEIRDTYFSDFEHTEDMIARDKFAVGHGIRHLVICGYVDNDPITMQKMHMMLELTVAYGCGATCTTPIAFVIRALC